MHSFVVPIYQVEKFLTRCLESISRQTVSDWEAVLVDDGSLDRSSEIAKQFMATDPRFRYLRQENAGLGAARNRGFEQSLGETVSFVDSDDWIHSQYVEILTEAMRFGGYDIVQFRMEDTSTYGETHDRQTGSPPQAMGPRRAFQSINSSAVTKIYRRAFLLRAGLSYPKIFHEDEAETFRLLTFSPRCAEVPNRLYYYWHHAASITGLAVNSRTLDYLKVIDLWEVAKNRAPKYEPELEIKQRDLLKKCLGLWATLPDPWAREGTNRARASLAALQDQISDNPYVFLRSQWEEELKRSWVQRVLSFLKALRRSVQKDSHANPR